MLPKEIVSLHLLRITRILFPTLKAILSTDACVRRGCLQTWSRRPCRADHLTVIFSSWAVNASSKSSCFWRRASTLPKEFPRSSFSRKACGTQKTHPICASLGATFLQEYLKDGPRTERMGLQSKVSNSTSYSSIGRLKPHELQASS